MKEILRINNFAGIKELEVELNKINIFIGPQASGKSITAKLIFYFKSFILEIRKGIENKENKREIDRNHINRFINYFPKETWPKNNFSIEYIIGETKMKIYKNDKPIKFEYSDNLKKLIKDAKKILKKEEERIINKKGVSNFEITINYTKKFNQLVKTDISPFSAYNQLFIPAGRSFFSNIQTSIFSFLNSNKSLDPFLIEFGSYYEHFKRLATDENLSEQNAEKDKDFQKLINEILNSNYLREKDKDFLLHTDKRKVNLSNASSGQQEILPLLIILKKLQRASFYGGGATLYIEEPEAHLFPNAQKKIIQLLARVFNSSENNFQIIVTTHSPYILSSFNNVMYAGNLMNKFKETKEAEINSVIPEKEIIMPDFVSAYSLDIEGNKTNLIDTETKLISQNILDSVSNEISIEFGKLLDIEYED